MQVSYSFLCFSLFYKPIFLASHLTSGALDSSPNRSVVMETLNVILDGMQELVSTDSGGVALGVEHLLGEYVSTVNGTVMCHVCTCR